ncbi:hypothetical protein DY000_02012065 [Brassica cretica]|uniref:Uncharacterized protein n=1 Tax=Brassica cretica TaxID=69181 RepID=A0ABQ7DCB0_BRACR|nr:hypothetical protein DY000_02012065 [Brassica cretica]
MSSKSRRKIPTTHVSSEFRRKWPTEFRRLQFFGFRWKLVGNPSQTSDGIDVRRNLRRNSACFLVVICPVDEDEIPPRTKMKSPLITVERRQMIREKQFIYAKEEMLQIT